MSDNRLYHVVIRNIKTQHEVNTTRQPVPFAEACVLLTKITPYSWRHMRLKVAMPEPVTS